MDRLTLSDTDGGFTSRILFVFGDTKRQLIHRPSQHWHGAEFDVQTGQVVGAPADVDVKGYKVVVDGEDIKIEV